MAFCNFFIWGCAIIFGTFGVLPDYWVPFWAIGNFFMKFDLFRNSPDFWVLILICNAAF